MGTNLNRFDALRLAFASMVFVYHAVSLSGHIADSPLELNLAVLAELSIQGFFIISGALVYGSWERSRGLADYASKRVRRLYPAYVVVILIPALISAILTFGQPGALVDIGAYLGANLIFLNFLEPSLPGLFESQRYSEVNGALWTLKIEVMFYLFVPVLAWGLSKLTRYWWVGIGVLAIGGLVWQQTALALGHPLSEQMARQLPGQMMYFAAGIAMWKLWGLVRAKAGLLLMIGGIVLAAAFLVPQLEALRALGLFGIIAGFAFVRGPELNAARWGDISYGVYIVHFPIVQGLVAVGLYDALGLGGGVAVSAVIVLPVSYLLWWWVEKPALRRDSHYRKVSEERAEEWPSTKPSNWTPHETGLPSSR
ncbi:MAG: acyltransferase [Pseudomonadota bacterium]